MNTPNKDLAAQALESLKGKWGLAIGTYLVYVLIMGAMSFIPFLGALGQLILGGPFVLGFIIFLLSYARNEEAKLEQIFEGFKNFGTALGTYLLMYLFILLWTLLLIIPGIIMGIAYSQAMFIIADEPDIAPMDAIRKSKLMMDGYKMKYFLFSLRFLGWAILCILTFGIGFLWLGPYMGVSFANFYEDIKDRKLEE